MTPADDPSSPSQPPSALSRAHPCLLHLTSRLEEVQDRGELLLVVAAQRLRPGETDRPKDLGLGGTRGIGRGDQYAPPVGRVPGSGDEPGALEAVDDRGRRRRAELETGTQLTGRQRPGAQHQIEAAQIGAVHPDPRRGGLVEGVEALLQRAELPGHVLHHEHQENHDRLFRGVLTGSALVGEIEAIRHIAPGVAVVYGTASVLMPWRSTLPKRRLSRQTIVVVNTGDTPDASADDSTDDSALATTHNGWRITAIHNGRVRPVTVPAPDSMPSRMSRWMGRTARRLGLGRAIAPTVT